MKPYCPSKFHLIWLLFFSLSLQAEQHEIELSDDFSVPSHQYGHSDSLILWLPSEHGIRAEVHNTLKKLSTLGFEVWAMNFHTAYFAPKGRKGIRQFDPYHIHLLLEYAIKQGKTSITLFSSGRGARVALRGLHRWQSKHPNNPSVEGLILMYPHLYDGRASIGKDASYMPIAKAINYPIYLFASEFSTKFYRTDALVHELQRGGAIVKTHKLMDVHSGFQARPIEDLTENDLTARAQLPYWITNAVHWLTTQEKPKHAVSLEVDRDALPVATRIPLLTPYTSDYKPEPKVLTDTVKKQYSVTAANNKITLINFWASWCGPCVEEIPSLVSLKNAINRPDFEILAINIGEPEEKIKHFVKPFNLNFPVLLDPTGSSVDNWKLYAFPSNYLLDRQGNITHAYFGALKWDNPEIISIINHALTQ